MKTKLRKAGSCPGMVGVDRCTLPANHAGEHMSTALKSVIDEHNAHLSELGRLEYLRRVMAAEMEQHAARVLALNNEAKRLKEGK